MVLSAAPDLVPMRWPTAELASLEILQGTPVNCLLLEGAQWNQPLIAAAHKRGMSVLGVVHPGPSAAKDMERAAGLQLDGVVAEGDFPGDAGEKLRRYAADSKLTLISMPSRAGIHFAERPIVATGQAVWPGIVAEEEGKTKAAPSGGPWINTNGGFLRFVRSAAQGATVWLGNTPPPKTVITPERYMQAIADAAIIGARWVIALDDDFFKRLSGNDASAMRDWKKIAAFSGWYEEHREWKAMQPLSELAILQDVDSGALYSGGVLDMIAVKHTPVRPVPSHSLTPGRMEGIRMAVDVDPSSLTDEQKAALAAFRRAGGSTLSGPATWKFPPVTPSRITLSDEDVKTLDEIWKEMNHMTGRRNLGVRLFNVSSMLSNLVSVPDGSRAVLHLVNYSGYPVENVTVHLLGKYRAAELVAPGEKPKNLQVYEVEDGTGVDVDSVGVAAALVLER